MLSIRNKRLLREIDKGLGFEVVFPQSDWDIQETMQLDVPAYDLTIFLKNTYPFHVPTMNVGNVNSCRYLFDLKQKVQVFADIHDYVIPCPCCATVRRDWTPTYGIKNLVEHYVLELQKIRNLYNLSQVCDKFPFDSNVVKEIMKYF